MILGIFLSLTLSASAAEIPAPQKGHASNPSWSADGEWLAFEINDYAGSIELYAVQVVNGNALGSPTKFTIPGSNQSSFSSGGTIVAAPNWHPKGMVIFEGAKPGSLNRLYSRMPKGGSASPMLNTSQIDGDLSWPSISPDGVKIAFVSDITGNGDVYVFDYTNFSVSAIVTSTQAEMAPRFNADGSKLVFSRKNRGGQDLFTWQNGSTDLLVGGNGDQTRPVWANDTVVFFSNERGEDQWDIATSTGSGQKKVIARDVRLPQRSTPAVSSDGRWIAYGSTDTTQSNKIFFVAADGSATRTIDTGLVACGDPALISNGSRTYVAFTALPSDGADWRRLHVEDVTNILN